MTYTPTLRGLTRLTTLSAISLALLTSACIRVDGAENGTGGMGGSDAGGMGGDDGEVEPVADVASVSLIGITPAENFAETGLVTFALLPKDANGEPVIDAGLLVEVDDAAGSPVTVTSVETKAPEEGKGVSTFINLDSSGSMAQNDPMDLRKDAAKQFVDALEPEDLVAVGDFGAGATAPFLDTRLLTDFTMDRTAIEAAIDQVESLGGTPMYSSLIEVIDYYETQGPVDVSRSIVVLGDGQPSPYPPLEEVCQHAQAAQIPLNTIGLGPAADASENADPVAVKVLRDLADCSGGAYTGVVAADDLGDAFSTFGQAARSGAVLITVQFSPVPAADTELEGEIRIGNESQEQGATVTYSFVAP